mmetsp:Transcript_138475/g.195978  ORF Transcript_138475/g.195978 Transcript_138475/m.195978 type:complete len:91 (+) Transcript_138475:51-323(+)
MAPHGFQLRFGDFMLGSLALERLLRMPQLSLQVCECPCIVYGSRAFDLLFDGKRAASLAALVYWTRPGSHFDVLGRGSRSSVSTAAELRP